MIRTEESRGRYAQFLIDCVGEGVQPAVTMAGSLAHAVKQIGDQLPVRERALLAHWLDEYAADLLAKID